MVSFRALIVPLLCVVACCCAGGCHSYETRAYDVMVRNDSPVPIVVWLTKDGPPYEQAWLSPEDIAIETPQQRDRSMHWTTIDPGREQGTHTIKGQFEPNTEAVLRVYMNAVQFSDLVAIGPKSPSRVDLTLPRGHSSWVVDVTGGRLAAHPASAAPAASASASSTP